MNYLIVLLIIFFIIICSINENYMQTNLNKADKNSLISKKNKMKIRNLNINGDQCGMKTENECYLSNQCGYCLHEKGFGVCLDGNENEPYDYNSCWKYSFKKH